MPDPIPPSDVDAEQALLGSIMIAPYLFVDLVTIVKAEYFLSQLTPLDLGSDESAVGI